MGLLGPDGDIVRYLAASGRGRRHPGWACYHTEMWTVDLDGIEIGVVGMAVGAPFAVLVAEQLAASGAELILSINSAGQISAVVELPCFVLIERRCVTREPACTTNRQGAGADWTTDCQPDPASGLWSGAALTGNPSKPLFRTNF